MVGQTLKMAVWRACVDHGFSEFVQIEAALMEGIRLLRSRESSLTPVEHLKLRSLLLNLKLLRGTSQDSDRVSLDLDNAQATNPALH